MYTNEEAAAQQYYNDTFTDRAYTLIWGGEHIHYGIYEQPDDSIPLASPIRSSKLLHPPRPCNVRLNG
jgi:hypothetical protein